MIDIIKPRRRVVVSYTLLPEEAEALERYSKARNTSKSLLISEALRKQAGFIQALQNHKEAYGHNQATGPKKYAHRVKDIYQDGFIHQA